MIYLDNSATTYPKPECVYKKLDDMNRNHAFNAGRGSYKQSTEAMQIITNARKCIAEYAGTDDSRVIFTSSATESLNMIINGLDIKENDNIYVSVFEHNAVIRPLVATKAKIHIIPFDKKTWQLDIDKLCDMFAVNNPKAVFLSHVSNVTGFVLPYDIIFNQSKKYNSINVLDCAQSFGVIKPANFAGNLENNILDYAVFAGHKSMYGPFGAAGFIKYGNDNLKISKFGGTGTDSLNPNMPSSLPGRYEAGSENVGAIAGMLEGFNWAISKDIFKHEYELTEYLIDQLKKLDNVKIYLPEGIKPLGIVSISVDNYNSEDVASILSEDFDICVRAGYHCAPYIHDFIESKNSLGTVRISLSAFNTKQDIDFLIKAIKGL